METVFLIKNNNSNNTYLKTTPPSFSLHSCIGRCCPAPLTSKLRLTTIVCPRTFRTSLPGPFSPAYSFVTGAQTPRLPFTSQNLILGVLNLPCVTSSLLPLLSSPLFCVCLGTHSRPSSAPLSMLDVLQHLRRSCSDSPLSPRTEISYVFSNRGSLHSLQKTCGP